MPTLAQAGQQPFTADQQGRLFSVAGSNTVGASLMKNLLSDYFAAKGLTNIQVLPLAHENEYRVQGSADGVVRYVDVAAHGSSTGFAALLDGAVEVAMSSRNIKGGEVEALAHYGNMLGFDAEQVIAIDGLAVIVNDSNPLQALDVSSVAKLFSGEIRNWKQLGGPDLAVNIYARDDRSGTWDTFKSLVLGKQYQLSPKARRFESNDQLSDLVAADKGGIGFVGLASVRESRALKINEEGTRPLLPQKLSVATEDYVLSRRLFLYTPPQRQNDVIRDFVHYVHTNAGQVQVERTGFISQALMATPADSDREGPQDYLQLTEGASRLSVNFRFAEGSAELDNKALRDIQRLVDYMQAQPAAPELQLVGFGDPNQAGSRGKVLSKLRALAVRSELLKAGITTQPVAGFGAFMPVAAATAAGKVKNRRVEVWVR
ncbi:substrate-binding domain-containing protein [Pseudomaricurvus sp. HS19]|uniref:substrate-binding domain-containing protein n=1 Tax=Pseudomaricurvus sp. HS19 TaxID=2692626 RepID=UPI00136B52D9|nr:phosphate ABC transporter substrate-binding/OmpA family protein [Pseudomaricurvus sp. HS19]MYM64129.1 OmpA family protein [Pseudomaricurvus sp. HS19]